MKNTLFFKQKSERFVELESSILDRKTGLHWSQENYGPVSWQTAMEFCNRFKVGLLDDWRLPTIEELLTLVDYTICNPATKLPAIKTYNYWSSTTYTYYPDYARLLYFGNGYNSAYYKYNYYYVRAVRGGPVSENIQTND